MVNFGDLFSKDKVSYWLIGVLFCLAGCGIFYAMNFGPWRRIRSKLKRIQLFILVFLLLSFGTILIASSIWRIPKISMAGDNWKDNPNFWSFIILMAYTVFIVATIRPKFFIKGYYDGSLWKILRLFLIAIALALLAGYILRK